MEGINMEAQQQEGMSATTFSNFDNVNNNSFMLMRIETESLINDIKNFLSAKEETIRTADNGLMYKETKVIGVPRANDEGIMCICNIVRMRVNHQVAQGNFDSDHYWDFISRARKEITETVVKKCWDWEIDDSDLNMIIDEVCALIEAYLTRPLNNKERESYTPVIQAREIITQSPEKQGMMASWSNKK